MHDRKFKASEEAFCCTRICCKIFTWTRKKIPDFFTLSHHFLDKYTLISKNANRNLLQCQTLSRAFASFLYLSILILQSP